MFGTRNDMRRSSRSSDDLYAVALINPPARCVEDDRLEPPLGLLYVAAAARRVVGDDIAFSDMSGNRPGASLEDALVALPRARVYGIQALCTNHDAVKTIVKFIRSREPRAEIVLGGPNPSALPRVYLEETGADAVVTGEGEDAFAAYLEASLAGEPLRGVVAGSPRDDIDGYAFPARDLADASSYSRRFLGEPVASLIASRGCPYRCAFCNSVVMGGGAARARFRSPGNLLLEIDSLSDSYRRFRFNDDCFTSNPRLRQLLAAIATRRVLFRAFARAEDLDPHTCDALREAGCAHVSVGLESLDPRNLESIGKGARDGREANIRAAKAAGLSVRAFFIVGLPFDDDPSIERYFGEAAELGIDEFTVYPLIPYPGTEIYRDPERFGYSILDYDFGGYVQIGLGGESCFALKHERFGPDDVRRWRARAAELLRAGGAKPSGDSEIAK
jgi:anaerobic magnesium-protoporphyrin IX monomethyl ester cyclase